MSGAGAPIGLLLAAGGARRYGGSKLAVVLPDGAPLVRHAALALLAVCRGVVVVTGGHRETVRAALADLPLALVDNPDWTRGLGHSIACGAEAVMALDAGAAVLLMLADLPGVDAHALQRIVDAGAAEPDAIIVSAFGDSRGPPCRFPPRLLPALAQLDGDEGARSVLRAEAADIRTVALPEAADDIDTRDDCRRIIGAPPAG